MSAQEYKAPESISRLERIAMPVAIVGIVISAIGWFKDPDSFFHSYLIAFLFVLGLSLGSLGLLMLHHLVSGQWGIVSRRPLEAAARTLLLVFGLFLLIVIFGMPHLYSIWLNAPATGEAALKGIQPWYLTHKAFAIRGIIYFLVWLSLVGLLTKWSKEQDVNREDRALRRKLKFISGPGIILYVFGVGFASIDWVMSLSPHWFSTIYGFIFVAGQLVSSMSLMIAITVLLSRTEPLAGIIKPRHIHEMSKLLLAFLMLWAYFSFSQLLIIWSGNQPDEISFFRSRLYGGFGVIAVILLILHFFVPFFLLLSRDLKRDFNVLPKVAVWLMLMRIVDLFWYTRPEFTSVAWPTVWDFGAVLALGGLWFYVFAVQLKKRPLLPLGEPKLAEVVSSDEH